jgi:plasmid stabilization system protein ParE
MTYQVFVAQKAEADLDTQANWYEHRCPGLGTAFRAKFELAVLQIQQFPHSCTGIDSLYRRIFLGRFPYFVVYRIVSDTIRILRVMPEAGNPRHLDDLD